METLRFRVFRLERQMDRSEVKISVEVRDEYARVIVDGKEVKTFSLLAEDYAISLARNYAVQLRIKNEKESNGHN